MGCTPCLPCVTNTPEEQYLQQAQLAPVPVNTVTETAGPGGALTATVTSGTTGASQTFNEIGTGSSSGVSGLDANGLINEIGSAISTIGKSIGGQGIQRLPNGQVLLPNGQVVGGPTGILGSGSGSMLLLVGIGVVILLVVMAGRK